MPVQLTTPIVAGGLDATTDEYAALKIIKFEMDLNRGSILLTCEYGNTVSNVWTPAGLSDRFRYVQIINHPAVGVEGEEGYVPASPDFTDLMAISEPEEGETTYQAVRRGIYQYLIDKGIALGSID